MFVTTIQELMCHLLSVYIVEWCIVTCIIRVKLAVP
jgi:hypothetical protein